ncbi:MAG: BamA/OMP85 family outer membrane protein [bacterium]
MFFILILLIFTTISLNAQEISGVIEGILVKGNPHVPTSTITDVVEYAPIGSQIDQEAIKKDIRNIYETGFFYDVEAHIREVDGSNVLVYSVVQNPILLSLEIEGNTIISDQEIKNVMESGKNRVLNKMRLEKDIQKILNLYKDKGYSGITVKDVDYQKDEEASTEQAIRGRVVIHLKENKVLGVNIEGLKEIEPELINPKITLEEGQMLSEEQINQTLNNLKSTGFFKDIVLTLEEKENGILVNLNVEEQKTGSYNLGVTYNERDDVMAIGSVREDNLLGSGKQVGAEGKIGANGYTWNFNYSDPYFKDDMSINVDIHTSKREHEDNVDGDWVEKKNGVQVTVVKDFNEQEGGYVVFDINSTEVDNPNIDDGSTNSVTLGYVKDTTDKNTLNKQEGYILNANIQTSNKLFGSDYNFDKYKLDYTNYFKGFSETHSIATHFEFGLSGDSLPRHEKFIASKSNGLKSYNYGEVRGDVALIGGAEYRVPIINENILGVTFLNIGNAWDYNDIKLTDLKYEWGVGTQVKTDFGVIRLDYAIGNDKNNFQINVGNNF